MSYSMDYVGRRIAAEASADARAAFIRRTYGHLAGAILSFAALETVLVNVIPAEVMAGLFGSRGSMLFLMLAFIAASWIANWWAHSQTSVGLQYAGLALYVVAEAIIFLPMLYIAQRFGAPNIIPQAGIMTLAIFAGLTAVVFMTRSDFSWLGSILTIACFIGLGVIIVAWIFGVSLGLWFSFGMVFIAGCFILYDTSNVLHHYRTDQHVAASLALFASVALLFWYILRILLASNRD